MFDKIGIGSVQFGLNYGITNTEGKTAPIEVSNILEYAKTQKINYIDTAAAYGTSEQVLGANDLTGFNVVSKFMPAKNGAILEEELEKSLQRLQVIKLYGYLAHRPQFLLENKEMWAYLQGLKEAGKVVASLEYVTRFGSGAF